MSPVLGVVVFGCAWVLVAWAIASRQERTGRGSRVLRAAAVPGSVPIVLAAVAGLAIAGLARTSLLAALVATGVVVVAAATVVVLERLRG